MNVVVSVLLLTAHATFSFNIGLPRNHDAFISKELARSIQSTRPTHRDVTHKLSPLFMSREETSDQNTVASEAVANVSSDAPKKRGYSRLVPQARRKCLK